MITEESASALIETQPSTVSTRRRLQNREAQRWFRERRAGKKKAEEGLVAVTAEYLPLPPPPRWDREDGHPFAADATKHVAIDDVVSYFNEYPSSNSLPTMHCPYQPSISSTTEPFSFLTSGLGPEGQQPQIHEDAPLPHFPYHHQASQIHLLPELSSNLVSTPAPRSDQSPAAQNSRNTTLGNAGDISNMQPHIGGPEWGPDLSGAPDPDNRPGSMPLPLHNTAGSLGTLGGSVASGRSTRRTTRTGSTRSASSASSRNSGSSSSARSHPAPGPGCSSSTTDPTTWPPALHVAVQSRNRDVAATLLQHCSAQVNARDEQGRTALHNAASVGDEDLVSLLLEYGADVNLCDSQGRDALYLAVGAGHSEVVEILMRQMCVNDMTS